MNLNNLSKFMLSFLAKIY